MTVIQIHQLRIGVFVADDNIEIAIAIDIDKRCGIRSVRRLAQIMCDRKAAMTVIEEHTVNERRMPPFCKDDVEMAVAVQVTDAHVGRCLGSVLQQQNAIELRESD